MKAVASARSRPRLSRRSFLRVGLSVGMVVPRGSSLAPDPESGGRKTGHLNYHPQGMYVWDSWYFTRGGEVHVIHLQKKRPGSGRPERDAVALGHAVSNDLLKWTELPVALYPGPEGSIDDLDLLTGCTFVHKGKYYLYYTARKRSEEGRIQRICLATSEDTIQWTKHPKPVIEPDPRWYEAGDCRDLVVVRHPQTGEFHGFYTTRIPAKELVESAVIAHVSSRDLIHWTHEPPVFAPRTYGILEEPDVFYLDGRWWMICATGNFDGVRGGYHDPYVTYGTIYAVADQLEGPYLEGDDNVLVGSMEFNGFSCRTVKWKGRRYVLYTQAERLDRKDRGPATLGCLTTPKELRVSKEGHLRPMYSSLMDQRVGETLIGDHELPGIEETPQEIGYRRFGTRGSWSTQDGWIQAASPKSWSVRVCGPEAESFVWTAKVRLETGRAIGLLFRGQLAVLLDHARQCVMFTDLPWMFQLEARRVHLEHDRTYHLRIISKAEFFEVYLDDALALNFVRYQPAKGRFGLYVEAGEGSFSDLRAVGLKV